MYSGSLSLLSSLTSDESLVFTSSAESFAGLAAAKQQRQNQQKAESYAFRFPFHFPPSFLPFSLERSGFPFSFRLLYTTTPIAAQHTRAISPISPQRTIAVFFSAVVASVSVSSPFPRTTVYSDASHGTSSAASDASWISCFSASVLSSREEARARFAMK